MIKRKEEMTTQQRENVKGGHGRYTTHHIFTTDELDKINLFGVSTMEPGASIGVHSHNQEGEVYLILSGSATVHEDGTNYILHAGDAEYCTGGHVHGILNHTDEPMTFMAIIIK